MNDIYQCYFCGISEDIHLLDGVLENEQDTGKLACIRCYPEGSWSGDPVHIKTKSVAPELKPLYDEYLRNNY